MHEGVPLARALPEGDAHSASVDAACIAAGAAAQRAERREDGARVASGELGKDMHVRAARQAGAQFVIAIDVSARPGTAPAGTSRAMLDRDATRRGRIDPEVADADFLIHPDMPYMAGPNRAYFVSAQAAGEASALQALPALRALLQATTRAAAR